MDAEFSETAHERIYLGHVTETPTDAEIGEGNVAFYAKSDGALYKRPYGGSESGIGGGGGGDVSNPMQEDLDANQQSITNAGAIDTESLDVSGWNWIDVTNHGVDNTGTESVVADINSLVADDTLLIFPSGEYFVPADETITTEAASANFGMVGRGDARFVHEADSVESKWLIVRGASSANAPIENLYLSNLTTDYSAANCGRGTRIISGGHGTVERFRQVGEHDSNLSGGGSVSLRCVGEGSVLDVINPRMPDGSTYHDTQSQQAFGIFVGEESTGRVRIKDAYIEGFADNAIYGSRPSGPVIVEGGVYKDNNKSGVRLASDGSAAYSPTVIYEDPDPNFSAIAINIRDGTGHVTIENPTIEIRNSSLGSDAIGDALRVGPDVASATIRGGRIEVASPTRLINFSPIDTGVEDEGILFEDLTYIRTADGSSNQHIARVSRDGVVFRNLTVKGQVGGTTDVRGLRINATENVRIEGGYYETDDRPLWIDGCADCVIDGIRGAHGTNAIDIAGPDPNVTNVSTENVDSWNIRSGNRPRWNDIIGGGPFAGIDLTTEHGRRNGDIARSDGTAADFPTGSVATWTGDATWIRADGQATISPP